MRKLLVVIALLFIVGMEAQVLRPGDTHHLIAGTLIGAGSYEFVQSHGGSEGWQTFFALAIPLVAAVAKELYDEYGSIYGSGFDMRDIGVTMTGAIVATVTMKIFTGKNKKKRKYAKL
jgi:hypothetical protein